MNDEVTRAEVCAVACAEAWRGDGEVMASPFGTVPAVGARLARLTFEPDLVLTDGVAGLMANTPSVSASPGELVLEAWMPYRRVFDVVWSGRRHIMMMASQVDRFGNQNLSAIGDWARPKSQLIGVRGAPGNSVNHTTSYWVPSHSLRTFVEHVDMVCGVGYDRAVAAGPAATRFHEVRVVVSNLGVFDFDTPDHAMRLRSVHPGVEVDDVVAATGFALVVPDAVPRTRLPTADELELIREVLDPKGRARQGSGALSTADLAGLRRLARAPSGAAHPPVRARRCPLPDRADRHGMGGGAAAGRCHRQRGRARHPGVGHHDRRRAGRGCGRGAIPHGRPLRREPPLRRRRCG